MPYTDQSAPHAGSAEVLFTGLFDEPAGTLARTIPRGQLSNATTALPGTGLPAARLIPLPAGLVVSNLAVVVGSTAEALGTHSWFALMDVNSNVLAVTADQAGAAFMTAGLFDKRPVQQYVIPQTGAYYVVVSVTAGTLPTLCGAASLNPAGLQTAPVIYGSLAAQQAPPAIGANLGPVSAANGANFGAWIS